MSAWLTMLLLAVAPLSGPRRELAMQTTDRTGFDEPGLYALLADAMTWPAGDEAGAGAVDLAALFADPSAHRGRLCLLEGNFAGRSRRVNLSNGADPFGRAVTEWVILPGDDPDRVAVIFFADPDAALARPATGRRVRVVARFYKIWSDTDARGNPTDYPLFVARHAMVMPQGGNPEAGGPGGGVIAGLLAGGVMVFLLLRRAAGKPMQPRRISRPGSARRHEARQPTLATDPADALEKLLRQREDDAS